MPGDTEYLNQIRMLQQSNSTITSSSSTTSQKFSLYIIIAFVIGLLILCVIYECLKVYTHSKPVDSSIPSAEVTAITNSQASCSLCGDSSGNRDSRQCDHGVHAYSISVSDVVVSIDRRDPEEVNRIRIDAVLPLYHRYEVVSAESSKPIVVPVSASEALV